jgi:hypothetical protein
MTCNCCTGIHIETPQLIANRAGLTSIAYRVGTYAQFRASMLAAIGTATAHGLRTRDGSDFAIAFLDACAVVGDVLTFYDERNANENYLRTAVELMSIGELARLIGYMLRPGASASAFLAFDLNDPPKTASPSPLLTLSSALGTLIPAGTKVQSIPGPGQNPATFETSSDLDARWVEDALAPRTTRPYPESSAVVNTLYVPDGGAGRTVGEWLILNHYEIITLRAVTQITVDPVTKVATLALDTGSAPAPPDPNSPAKLPAASGDLNDATISQIVDRQIWDRDDLATLIERRTWSMDAFEATVNNARMALPEGPSLIAYTVRSGALFGHNAPLWGSLPPILRYQYSDTTFSPPKTITPPYTEQWDKDGSNAGDTTLGTYQLSSYYINSSIDLDNVYPQAVPGAFAVFVDHATSPNTVVTGIIDTATVVSRSLYAMTGRVTTLTLVSGSTKGNPGSLHPRTTAVFISDMPVPLAPIPITDDVGGTSILLNRCALRLPANRYVAISGERRDMRGRTSVEIAQISQATLEDGFTRLTFGEQMAGSYLIETASINANVVDATNGETVTEVLGSGDASVPFQSFTLKQLPLTWTSSPKPEGVDAAITVRVNGIEWKRVPYLYGSAPTDRVYTLLRDKTGATIVRTGDGVTFGARLPTGQENVTAVYRRGIGTAGQVDAGQLSMLITRPPGAKDVNNPVAASGAADPETAAQARVNAPYAVRTLDRIVTLEDYGDFVRASAGIAKSRVDLGWSGSERIVLLTIAGPGGALIPDVSIQSQNLLTALHAASEGAYPIELHSYRPRTFVVRADLATDPAYAVDAVYAAVQAALAAAFSFGAREFGQPVFASEVITVIQSVPGVIAANLTTFCYTEDVPATLQDELDAQPAALSGASAVGAELLSIDTAPAKLAVFT